MAGPGVVVPGLEATRALFGRRPVYAALLAYLVVRAVGLCGLFLAAHHAGRSTASLLGQYDGGHYLAIARHGYDARPQLPGGAPAVASPAFHPLFPALVAVGLRLWPGSDLTAALLVAWACGVAAAVVVFRVGARLLGARTGVVLVALWAALPHAVVGSMVYAEYLFTALAGVCLLLVLDRRWVAAGAACALAGLTRPTGTALAVVVGLAVLAAVVTGRDGWRPWLGGLLAPAGVLGYWAWVGWFLGRWDGYFWLQDAVWHTRFDAGADTASSVGHVLSAVVPLALTGTTVVLFVSALAAVVLVTDRRVPWPFTAYCILVVVLVLGTGGYYYAKARLLLPAFPLLLPVAHAVAHMRRTVTVVVLVGAAVGSAWYGSYLLTVWSHSP